MAKATSTELDWKVRLYSRSSSPGLCHELTILTTSLVVHLANQFKFEKLFGVDFLVDFLGPARLVKGLVFLPISTGKARLSTRSPWRIGSDEQYPLF